jgi:WD40 repeat protein
MTPILCACIGLLLLAPGQAAPRLDADGLVLPDGATVRLGTVKYRYGGFITGVAFGPGDRLMACVARDGLVRVWQTTDGKELHRFVVPGDLLAREVAFAPDGSGLALTWGNGVRVWNLKSGREVVAKDFPRGGSELAGAAWCRGGKEFAVLTGDMIYRWQTETGKSVDNGVRHKIAGIVDAKWGAEGKLVVLTQVRNRYALREAETGKVLHGLTGPAASGTAVLCPDLDTFALNLGNEVQLWQFAGSGMVHQWPVTAGGQKFAALAFSASGKELAAAYQGGGVVIWDTRHGKQLARYSGQNSADSVAFSADGQVVATGNDRNTVTAWNWKSDKQKTHYLGHYTAANELAFAADGKTLWSSNSHQLLIQWDAATGKQLQVGHYLLPWNLDRLLFSPDRKKLIALEDGEVSRVIELETGKTLRTWQVELSGYSLAALSGNGRFLATVKNVATVDDRTESIVSVWDMETLIAVRQWSLGTPPLRAGLAFSPDGSTLATGGTRIQLWNAHSGRLLHKFRETGENQQHLDFSPDGRWLVSMSSKDMMVWETLSGAPLLRVEDVVWDPQFSPDGKLLAAGTYNGRLLFWDTATIQQFYKLEVGQSKLVSRPVFAPDGGRLASTSDDASILIWDLAAVWEKRKTLTIAPGTAGEIANLWGDLIDGDALVAHRAMQKLGAAKSLAVDMLRGRLQPVAGVRAEKLLEWIEQLDAPSFQVRERATLELDRIGEAARPLLEKALEKSTTPEFRVRADYFLKKWKQPDEKATPTETWRTLRAIAVLESIGSPGARAILERIAGGAAGTPETEAASSALLRLRG